MYVYVHVYVEVCQDTMHAVYILPKLCVANFSMKFYQPGGFNLPKDYHYHVYILVWQMAPGPRLVIDTLAA